MSNLMKDRKVTVNFVYWISNISKGASLLERGRTEYRYVDRYN